MIRSALRMGLSLACVACGESAPIDGVAPVVVADQWRPTDAGADPFDDVQEASPCLGGIAVENGALEVDTERCAYASLTQQSLVALAAGSVVRISFSHARLVADSAATAHAAVAIDGHVIWERHIAIPGDSHAHRDEVVVPKTFPPGADVVVHLHNHGANTYQLHTIELVNERGEP